MSFTHLKLACRLYITECSIYIHYTRTNEAQQNFLHKGRLTR